MSETPNSKSEEDIRTEADLAHKQALQYGQDLVEIYKQERQKRQILEMAYKKLEIALESMSEGFLVIDKSLAILEINHACANLFDISPVNAQGKPLSEILIGPNSNVFCQRLLKCEVAKINAQLELTLPVQRTITIQGAPLPGGGWILVLHDVTWEYRVNNMREEFLHLASHELRTPLAGVIGFTSLLEQVANRHGLDEEARSILAGILRSAEKLRQSVKDIVDFSLKDSQDSEIEPVDLRATVEDGLALLQKLAAEKEVLLKVDLSAEPMLVFGHREMLSTAMGHLIENGIRYNKKGGSLAITGQANSNTYSLIFADTGQGIARTDREQILKPFYQSEIHTTRHSVGMGLGLAIVQRILNLHRGKLELDSKLGQGSEFRVILPRYSLEDIQVAREEWLLIRNRLNQQANQQETEKRISAQVIIDQLKDQLEVTQSQNMAYAKDLAKLYQTQRADAQEFEAKKSKITHADRLALMGQLAAGVAHDLSNLIGPILGYSQIILRRRDSIDPKMVDIIERILTTSRRANTLLRQMVTLSRTDSENYQWFDLNYLIKDILQLLEVKIKHANIDLIEAYTDKPVGVYGNSVQISQVVLNIVINAIDAISLGGVITIKTAARATTDGNKVQLQISDTGYGIPPENLDHIFEAFFTTKEEKSGTGLGLSVTKQIIDDHNGKISVDSVVGKGTTFTILLPAQKREVDHAR